MASAAESEVSALFLNGQEAIPLRNTLIELGHPLPPTPLQTDNTTAAGFANDTIKKKDSRPWTCTFTGSNVVSDRTTSTYTGALAVKI
jgi:hypothetical protein